MEKNIDIRRFSFKKLVLPKTKEILYYKNGITISYFDLFHVEPIAANKAENPLEAYARTLEKELHKEEEFTYQQILAFTNIRESKQKENEFFYYDPKKIDRFWKTISGFTYISMLHVEDSNPLNDVINKIDCIFNNSKSSEDYHAVCYFSLDYSDLVICVKNMEPEQYLDKICQINYDGKKLIKNAFSIIGISDEITQDIFQQIKENDFYSYKETRNRISKSILKNQNYKDIILNGQFHATIKLGIQNYSKFKDFCENLRKKDILFNIYELFGHHDFSIDYEKADLIWILYMQYYIDKNSIADKKESREEIFFNSESYIKIQHKNKEYMQEYSKDINHTNDGNNKNSEEIEAFTKYEKAKQILDILIARYSKNNEFHKQNKNICLKPIIAMKNSILGLLKDEFAEEFVLCFFEAFCMFLKYITEKLDTEDKKIIMKSYQCFNEYFDNLNSLINSAMHNERQFIQTPAFNAVFYDIPTKLIAYYTALTNYAMYIARTENDKNYSIILRPSFWQDVSIVPYSFDEPPSVDRLLSVYINEQDLYRPKTVTKIICHEIAHYVGDENRNREARKEAWLKNMLYSIINLFVQNNLGIEVDEINYNELYRHIKKLMDEVIKQESFYANTNGYSIEIRNLILKAIGVIIENPKAKKITFKILSNFITNENKENNEKIFEYYLESTFRRFRLYLKRVKFYLMLIEGQEEIKISKTLSKNYERLEYIFSESYADLQMILILELKLEEYIKAFLIDENKSADDIRINSIRTYYRIFNIVLLFHKIKKWNVYHMRSENLEINKFIKYLQIDIEYMNIKDSRYKDIKIESWLMGPEDTKDIFEKDKSKNNMDSFENLCMIDRYLNANVQQYLIEVLKKSSENYKKKHTQIMYLRKKSSTIDRFDNIIKVLECIHTVNTDYSNKLYNIAYWENIIHTTQEKPESK